MIYVTLASEATCDSGLAFNAGGGAATLLGIGAGALGVRVRVSRTAFFAAGIFFLAVAIFFLVWGATATDVCGSID
jgi:hypothetical protein